MPEVFDNLKEAIQYVVDRLIPQRRCYVVKVREPNATAVQVSAEDVVYENGGVGLTIHLPFDSDLLGFFDVPGNFNEYRNDRIHCFAERVGTNALSAVEQTEFILSQLYGYHDLSGLQYEVHDEGPVNEYPTATEYYEDSCGIYACLGSSGHGGIFQIMKDPKESEPEWKFFAPFSPHWDAFHQQIFRNFRLNKISDASPPVGLPPLPNPPKGPFPAWEEYFLPDEPLRVSGFPLTASLARQQDGQTLEAFVILSEDEYERSFGDGEFHDFLDAFPTEAEAEQYIAQNRKGMIKLHLRTMRISLVDELFDFPGFKLGSFDYYKPAEVLAALEANLFEL